MGIPTPTRERGQSLVLIALGLIGLLGFVALAIDGGMVLYDRRSAQNAADAAALAGAYRYAQNPWRSTNILCQDIQSEALSRAADNHYGILDGKTITVNWSGGGTWTDSGTPPLVHNCLNATNIHYVVTDNVLDTVDKHYVQVAITSKVRTTFLHFVYSGDVYNTVQSTAHITPPKPGNPFEGSGLVALAPSKCAASSGKGGGIYLSGTSITNLIGGGMFINSDASCSLDGPGGSYLTYSPSLTDVGGVGSRVGGNLVVQPGPATTGATDAALDYPPGIIMPDAPTCSSAITKTKTDTYINPKTGQIETDSRGNPIQYDYYSAGYIDQNTKAVGNNIVFETGVYCVRSGFDFNAGQNIRGEGVLFYVTGSRPCNFSWNAAADIRLKSPTNGTYQGLLVYVDTKNFTDYLNGGWESGGFSINGNSNSYINGTFYAPTCSATLNGTGGSMYQGQMIAFNIVLSGTNTFYMDYITSENFKVQLPAKIDLAQ